MNKEISKEKQQLTILRAKITQEKKEIQNSLQ